MKKYNLLTSLLAISLIFSADLMAGKNKKKKGRHSPATVVRKAPNSQKEEMALVPVAPPPPPPSLALIVPGKEEKTDKKGKKILSFAKDAKSLLQTGAKTLKNIAMGQPLSDQVLKFGREGLRSVALGNPPSFVSPEIRLLQSVVLRSVPLDQKAKAIGGQRESYKGVSLLAERRGEDLEKELQMKAGGTRERLEAWQLIQDKSENPERRAFLEEVVHEGDRIQEQIAAKNKAREIFTSARKDIRSLQGRHLGRSQTQKIWSEIQMKANGEDWQKHMQAIRLTTFGDGVYWSEYHIQQTWVGVQFASSGKRHQKILEDVRYWNGKMPTKTAWYWRAFGYK